ncbi:MAG: hypothetical protein ACQEXN_13450 [Actinomycetota bacterium]
MRWPDGFVCPKCGGCDYWRTVRSCGCAKGARVGRR